MENTFFRFCIFAYISLFSFACTGSKNLSISGNEFLIEGEIFDVENGAVIHLSGSDRPIASNKLKNGRFILKGETTSDPERMSISVTGDGYPSLSFDVWTAPGARINITGSGKLHPLWNVESPVSYQREENLYVDYNREIIAEILLLNIERNLLRRARDASSGNKALAYKAAADSVNAIYDALRDKQFFANMDIMEKTDISLVWLDKMKVIAGRLKDFDDSSEYYGEQRKKAETLYGRMSEEDKTSPTGYDITMLLFPPSAVKAGEDMADADLVDAEGNTKHISDYLGKYLLLDFWANWCGPCLAAIPEMKEISETYKEKLTIISISLDTDAIWKEALKTHDMPWVNIRDPKSWSGLAAHYNVRSIPYYVLISPEGRIIVQDGGYSKGKLKWATSEYIK